MENCTSSLPNASERSEINHMESSIIPTDFKMGSQTLCNLFHWAHAGLDHCKHGEKNPSLWRVGLLCSFHFCQFDPEECKINETFQAELCVNNYLLCFMSFSHLQHTRGQECLDLEMWIWALYTAGQGNGPDKRISASRWAHSFGWDSP